MLRRFFKSRSDLEHPNPKIRRSAIDKLPDIAQDKFLQIAKTDKDITLSLSFNFIPFIPLEDLPLNNLNFLDLNLMHLPN